MLHDSERAFGLRFALVLSFIFLLAVAAAAQDLPVDPPETVAAFFETAQDIKLVDWDLDGRLDIIAAASDGGSVEMWRNKTFGYLQSSWPIIGTFRSIDVGDIDGNGQPDLLYGLDGATADRVGVVLNRASDFLVTVDDTMINSPEDVLLVDLDGDGDLDIVTSELNTLQVSWHENVNGDGETWSTSLVTSSLSRARYLDFGDIDADGDPDLVAITDGGLVWIENDLGSTPAFTVHVVDGGAVGNSVKVGDIDGDGELEIVSSSGSPARLAWWDRPAVLTQPWTRHDVEEEATRAIAIADMDHDGDLDLVSIPSAIGAPLRLWHNDGAALFTKQELTGGYSSRAELALGDLDLDGDLDIAVAGGVTDVVETIENRLVRSSVLLGSVEENRLLGQPLPLAMATADMDRDGDLDIVSYDDDGVLRLRDTFDSAGTTLASVGETLLDPRAFGLGDIDGDGDLDVVAGFAERFAWFENLGGVFVPKTLQVAAQTTDLLVFDVTGDGDDDLIAYDRALGVVRVWRNVGPGASWTINAVDGVFDDYRAMTAGDLDHDGIIEIIVSADDAITAYTRVADIAFLSAVVDAGYAPPHLVAGDFDADGDVDIAGDVPESSTLVYWTSDGLGGFAVHESDFVSGVAALGAADYDLDGDLDVVGVSEAGFSAIVFTERTSPSPFSPEPFGFPDFKSRLLTIGDFTGDGYPDTVGAASDSAPVLSATIAGQFEARFLPAASGEVDAGSSFVVAELDLEHLGRPGDQEIELKTVSLALYDQGLPLTGPQVDGLLRRVTLLRDDGSVVLAELVDPSGASPLVLAVTPAGGAESVPAPSAPGAASEARFRLELELEDQPTLDAFTVFLNGSSHVTAEDSMGTALEPWRRSTQSRVFSVIAALFIDGFESGDTSAWSAVVP